MDRIDSIYIENKQDEFPINSAAILEAAGYVLDEEGIGQVEVAITFVDSQEMSGLNKHYRDIDGPTDVLSFSMKENAEGQPDLTFPNPEEILGDIIVCPAAAAENADHLGYSTEREILEITIHGLLHLLGYAHGEEEDEKRMMARQEELAAKFR